MHNLSPKTCCPELLMVVTVTILKLKKIVVCNATPNSKK